MIYQTPILEQDRLMHKLEKRFVEKYKKKDRKINDFFNFYIGKTECFNVYWNDEENPDEVMEYYDFNSLYPHVSIVNEFPIGNV